MINRQFVSLMNNTEFQAKRFFEANSSLVKPIDLIEKAAKDGYLDNENIDADLFRHLMKKYTFVGIK